MQNLVDWMEKFVAEANKFLAQMTDERFTYRGLKVKNPDRLPEPMVRKLLNGIDYVLALFKKRGVTTLLDKTLDNVVLRHPTSDDAAEIGRQQSGRSTVSGWFHWSPSGGTVTLMSNLLDHAGARFLTEWINEVFLHEVGHHVHLSLLDRQARKEWDSGWVGVKQAKEAVKEADDKTRQVSHPERQRFWEQLLAVKGDLKKVKLKGLDRMKFHAWLSTPMTGGTILTPKNLQWAADGKWIKPFMEDPEGYISKDYGPDPTNWGPAIERRWRQLEDKFGVADSYAKYNYPTLSPEQVKEYAANDDQVSKALDALEMPSYYARTDEMEDFAESFVAFMDAPEKLSKQAKYRMQRALHMSGLAGKPIMKVVAKLVAEARALLQAARPIPVNKAAIRELVDDIVKGVGAVLQRYPNQEDKVQWMKLPIWHDEINDPKLLTVTGQPVGPIDVLVTSQIGQSPDLVLGGGIGRNRVTGQRALVVTLNGRYKVSALKPSLPFMKDELFSLLIHEFTHLKDKIGDSDGYRKVLKDRGTTLPTFGDDLDGDTYFNDPAEVRSHMQEIVHEVLEMASKIRPHYDANKALLVSLKNSATWQQISPHLTVKNKNLIMKAVYTAIQDAGLLS